MSRGPDRECGITITTEDLIARSASRAVVVRSLIAYSDGVLLTVTMHSSGPVDDRWHDMLTSTEPGNLTIAYGFAGGNDPFTPGPAALVLNTADTERELVTAGASVADTADANLTVWLSPRQTGVFEVIVQWPDGDIETTHRRYPMPNDDQAGEQITRMWEK